MEMAPRSDSSTGSVAIDPFTRGSRRRRLRHQEIRHCQRAASPSLKANPSPASSSVASAEDIAAFQAVEDGLVGKMYRFRERRLELQQQRQHHKCKSSRRTVENRGSVASSGGGKVVSLNGGNCEGSASSAGEQASLGGRSRRRGHFWVASAGRPNVLLAVVLFLLAGFCTQSGCDDTEQFQKNSE